MARADAPRMRADRSWSAPPAAALLASCHLGPTLAVTALAAGLAVLSGLGAGRVLLLTAAVAAGQCSIGFSNDALDAERDRASGRADKPVALGQMSRRTVGVAAAASLLVCVALSALLGAPAALASIVIAVCGWCYNLGLKATAVSFAPYAVAFGLLPAVPTLALPDPHWPPAWAVAAAAILGVAAHLANVLPDLADDRATGVRGLPHRLGARASAAATPVLLFAAVAVIVLGSGSRAWWPYAVLAAVGLGAGAGAVVGYRRPGGRGLFAITVLAAAAALVLYALLLRR